MAAKSTVLYPGPTALQRLANQDARFCLNSSKMEPACLSQMTTARCGVEMMEFGSICWET